MALKPISVSQLNDYISRVLTTDPLLGNVSVIGEISNLKYHSTGHVYFSVNDESSKINCFFPSSYAKNLTVNLTDGMAVTLNGYINVYKKGGTYTLFVRSITVEGEGNLAIAFQAMKDKLEKEGLFARDHKKLIPEFPKKIGIITSKTGAAVQDIIKIISSRNTMVDIIIFPVSVQGEGAAATMVKALKEIEENPDLGAIDTLIIGRGGGSTEDLWAFNDEALARAIYDCRIPIISAVGHEIDFAISDFVADRRAETPTAAAEMAVPDLRKTRDALEAFKKNLLLRLNNKVDYCELKAENLLKTIKNNMERRISSCEYEINTLKLYLEENNPLHILEKGYAIVEDTGGKVISEAESMKSGEEYEIRFKDGKARVSYEGRKS